MDPLDVRPRKTIADFRCLARRGRGAYGGLSRDPRSTVVSPCWRDTPGGICARNMGDHSMVKAPRTSVPVAWHSDRCVLGDDFACGIVPILARHFRELWYLDPSCIDWIAFVGPGNGGRCKMEVIAIIVPMFCIGVTLWFLQRLDNQYEEKLERLARERDSAKWRQVDTVITLGRKLNEARLQNAQQETYFAERLAAANERQRLLEEKLAECENDLAAVHAEKQATYGLPDNLHAWCAKAAYMVLQSFPISEEDRARLATTATIGALTSVRDASGLALARYLDTVKIDARLSYGVRMDESTDSNDDRTDDADPDNDPDGSDSLQ